MYVGAPAGSSKRNTLLCQPRVLSHLNAQPGDAPNLDKGPMNLLLRHATRPLGAATTLSAATRRLGAASSRRYSGTVYGGESSSPACRATFDAWHESVSAVMSGRATAESLRDSFGAHVHPACMFRPPTYYAPWEGRDETLLLLGCVSEVFGSSFQYGRQWLSEDGKEWALEFTAEIEDSGRTLQGMDLVSLCDEGLIRDFTVLARPPNAVAELKAAMMRRVPVRLAALKAKRALGLV